MSSYEKWLNEPSLDIKTKKELLAIAGKKDEIEMRFGRPMSFGTAGLRSKMMAGIACMNTYTVAHATQALANLIKDEGGKSEKKGVVVAYDSRNNSLEFAKTACDVLCANGIKVYLFDDIRPTPELSFAVRELGCAAGINITASHNPKEYNGYKVYGEDSAQLSPESAAKVSAYMAKADIFADVLRCDCEKAIKEGGITLLGEDFDKIYLSRVICEAVDKSAVPAVADSLKIVYTPLHGAGYKLVPEVLRAIGFKQLLTVEEQMTPNGDFPTVKKPNPELEDAFAMGIALAEREGSDLVLATDPDCDRVGAMSRDSKGAFRRISGNQMGALLLDYILKAKRENGGIPKDAFAVKTIVTTEMVNAICESYGVKLYNVLTGFKFIGEVIKNSEISGRGTYMFGFEESYGYLKGTYARDKDAVVASMLIGEMTAHYKAKNMTLCDALDALFEKYGYYGEHLGDYYMEGADGSAKREAVMLRLRKAPPAELCGKRVAVYGDYLKGVLKNVVTGREEPTNLPSSDVLSYMLEDGDVIIIRPSGTEPKIKLYGLLSAKTKAGLEEKTAACSDEADKLIQA